MTHAPVATPAIEQRVRSILDGLSLAEKIGQLCLANGSGGHVSESLRHAVAEGRVGAVLNEVDPGTVNELQRIAVEESRAGIPLLIGRDVIHGFRTVFPIPLGQAATWNPELVEACARAAALEASETGVNWTFAPVLDIGRDPRWGRVAETLGEDPCLAGALGRAAIRGFQGEDLSRPGRLAACAKHFAGYGASEAGRDYNTTSIPEIELRNVHLPPFEEAIRAGVATVMTSFSDLNGVPATANDWLLRTVLREEWGFDGLVVSDWSSIPELAVHGLTEGDRESALAAARAGVDLEMASTTFADHLASLVEEGRVSEARIDEMVANVLRTKVRLGLFERRRTDPTEVPAQETAVRLDLARTAARQSIVLLHDRGGILPLHPESLGSVAVIGPLADDPYEQLGTWIFDGDPGQSRTPLDAIRELVGDAVEVRCARGVATTRSRDVSGFDEAVEAARGADVALLFLGEESILSGEAHCRADIRLPGVQEELIAAVAETGTPTALVLMAGRPLALQGVVERVGAALFAWHPGTMAGPALADLLFGRACPSGKLPVTIPKVTGQIPIYHAHRNTGRPATPGAIVDIEAIEPRSPQTSVGNAAFHLDAGIEPLFPFGHGLSYVSFAYRNIAVEPAGFRPPGSVAVSADVTNTGSREAEEVVQLYVRDLVGSVTRPVRELKGFRRVRVAPGETLRVRFELDASDLAFHGRDMRRRAEPGRFHVWIGGSSDAQLRSEFELLPPVSGSGQGTTESG